LSGGEIDHYQSTGTDFTEEQHYQDAVDHLAQIFSSTELAPEGKLEAILREGLQYFDLDTAFISSIDGDKYTVRVAAGAVPDALSVGAEVLLDNTICSQFYGSSVCLAVDDLSNSAIDQKPCHVATGIESFVGASVQTANGPFGTVSFSSQRPRKRDYSVGEESFSLLIAGWVGYLLGNIEQIDFMESQNDYYKTLFKSVPAMMMLCDADGLILSASDQFSEQVRVPTELVPGKNCFEFFADEEVDQIKSTLSQGSGLAIPAKLSQGDSTPLEVELNISEKPIGTLEGIRMVIVTDVSPRNQAAREAAEKNRRLEVANESLNQFAFIASHDLQEPLRKIQQFSSFLEEDLKDSLNDDGRYHLNVIVDASQRMSTLIYDLLNFSGISKVEATLEPIPLKSLVAAITEDLELSKDKASVFTDFDQLPTIQASKPLFKQLLTNLLSNSVKYRDKDRSLEVRISTRKDGDREQLIYEDNGIGFDMQFAKKIFEPFNRLHNTKQYKGNGIGLAICQTVCEKHGWTIAAEGTPGEGSKFTVTITDG